MRLGVVPLLGLIVPGVAFDQREGLLLASAVGGERGGVDFGLKGNASEVLLFIVFSNGKFIVSDIEALQCARIIGDSLLEFLVFLLEGALQAGHDLVAFALEAELGDGLLDSDAQVCFLDYILQLRELLVYKGKYFRWADL